MTTATTQKDETVEQRAERRAREQADARKAQRKQAYERMTAEEKPIAEKAELAAATLIATLHVQGHTVKVDRVRFDLESYRVKLFVVVPSRVNGQSVCVDLFAAKNREGDLTGQIRFKVSSQAYNLDDARAFREPKIRGFDFTKIAAVLVEYAAKKKVRRDIQRHHEARCKENKRAAKAINEAVGNVEGLNVRGSHDTDDDTEFVKVTFEQYRLTPDKARKVAEAIKAALTD